MYRACQHIKPNGLQCQSPAMRRNAFCYFHSKAHGITRTSSRDDLLLPIAEGHAAVQLAVHQIIQALLARQIDAKEAGTILYGIQIASQHIKVESKDPTGSVRFFANSGAEKELAIPLCIREAGDKAGHDDCSNCGQRFHCSDYQSTQAERERYERLADLSDDVTPTVDADEEIEEDAEEDSEVGTEETGEEIPAEIAAQSAEQTASDPQKDPASGHEFTRAENTGLVSGHDLSHVEENGPVSGHDFTHAEEKGLVSGHEFTRADEAVKLNRALEAAEKLGSDAVLKGHGFIRADKSKQNAPALAAEGWFCSHPAKSRSFSAASLAPEGSISECKTMDETISNQQTTEESREGSSKPAPESESIVENVAAVSARQQVSHHPPCKRTPNAPRKSVAIETSPTIKPAEAIALVKAFLKLNSAS